MNWLAMSLALGLASAVLFVNDAQIQGCPGVVGWAHVPFLEPSGPSVPPYIGVDISRTNPQHAWYGIKALAQRWDDPSVLYGGGSYGVYRSGDCGGSWERLPYPRGRDSGFVMWEGSPPAADTPNPVHTFSPVAVSPSGRLFFKRSSSYFWASDDDGQTWKISRLGAVPLHLVIGPRGTVWVIAARPERVGWNTDVLAVSTDDGETWTKTPNGVGQNDFTPSIFTVDPRDESVLIIGRWDGRVTRSGDGGRTETEMARFAGPIRGVAASLDGRYVWVADGEDTFMQSADGGRSWQSIAGAPGRVQRNGLYASHAIGNAVFVLTDTGELWSYRAPEAAPAQVP